MSKKKEKHPLVTEILQVEKDFKIIIDEFMNATLTMRGWASLAFMGKSTQCHIKVCYDLQQKGKKGIIENTATKATCCLEAWDYALSLPPHCRSFALD